MKLTLNSDTGEILQTWDLAKDIGDMREPRSRRILYRELIEEIDYRMKYCSPLPKMKSVEKEGRMKEATDYLARLTPEERAEFLREMGG